ncbi:hypothetical protein ES705_09997 [subsurface metagenome]
MAGKIAETLKQVDPERMDRICKLSELQDHIALLTIADMICQNGNCDTISFEQALDIAETY